METSGFDIALHQFIQPRFIDRHNTILKFLDFFFIYIHASNIDTHFGKASS